MIVLAALSQATSEEVSGAAGGGSVCGSGGEAGGGQKVFRSDDMKIKNFLLCDDELDSFPPCLPLLSCHCQLEFCGCVGVLSLCPRTCSRCQSFASCKSGCLVVAMVPAPPAVVCSKWYAFDQCSRSAAVATCSPFGPSARRSHYFTFSSVTTCD